MSASSPEEEQPDTYTTFEECAREFCAACTAREGDETLRESEGEPVVLMVLTHRLDLSDVTHFRPAPFEDIRQTMLADAPPQVLRMFQNYNAASDLLWLVMYAGTPCMMAMAHFRQHLSMWTPAPQ